MDSKALVLAFSPAQLALLLVVAVALLALVAKFAVNQFQRVMDERFRGFSQELTGTREEIASVRAELKRHPTKDEMRAEIRAHVAEARAGGHPWRRMTDETLPGAEE